MKLRQTRLCFSDICGDPMGINMRLPKRLRHFSERNGAFSGKIPRMPIISAMTVYGSSES